MEEKILAHFLSVKAVSTDTRKIPKNSIFFALKGEKFNGNSFALQALDQGASMVVVDEDIQSSDDRIVRVENVLESLQKVAGLYRNRFSCPFLAITGSNGKTTTKELVRDVLAKKYKVSATIGNLNNHIGIPLTLLSIPGDCEFAIIEMGANHQGEIRSYCEYARPDFAMITNMGKAHLEGFGGEEGVIKGKKELYDFVNANQGKLFVNVELEKLENASHGMNRIEYGFKSGSFEVSCLAESPTVSYSYRSDSFIGSFDTHLAGAYNLYNIASAIAVGKYFMVDEQSIISAIGEYLPDNNRSQVYKTAHNTLVLDAYNANPTSLELALISLANQKNNPTFFVIGDMLELGESAPKEHTIILNKAKELGLNGIVVGPIFSGLAKQFGYSGFINNTEAKQYITTLGLRDHMVLIKGSRGIKLEELVSAL